jgi:uncharacterized protein (DUF1330 family)
LTVQVDAFFYQPEENAMSRYLTIGLSMIAGAALGVTAVQTLHAQAKPMAYVIAENTVNNQDAYLKDFAPAITKAIEANGGKYLARGGKTASVHGTAPAGRIVILQFESLDKAQAWANSQPTKDAFAIGEKYAAIRDYIVEGVSP